VIRHAHLLADPLREPSTAGLEVVRLRPSDHKGPDGVPVSRATSDNPCGTRVLAAARAEEISPAGSAAPTQSPTGAGMGTVPAWRGLLAGPNRLRFRLRENTLLVLSVEGVLEAVSKGHLVRPSSPPGAEETAVELPWRLINAPVTRTNAVWARSEPGRRRRGDLP
jgi:hypothetical protein